VVACELVLGDRLLIMQRDIAPNDMPQSLLKRLLAERTSRNAVGVDLLKPRSSVRDPAE
jgi:hypothetical protein